jgi:hypothetical protein
MPFQFKQTISLGLVFSIAFFLNATQSLAADNEDDKPWHIGASAGIEYSDNVTRPEKDIVSGNSDHAYVFELNGGYKFIDSEDFEMEASYDFYQSLYDDSSTFDFQSHGFNLGAAQDLDKLDFGADLNYTTTELDEKDFMDLFMFIPRAGFLLSPKLYTDISYMFQDKDFETENTRDATQHSIGLTQFLFFMDSKAYLSGSYRLASEDASGAEFDYLAHIFKATLKIPGPFDTRFKASYEYKNRDYDNVTASIGREREDKINTFKGEVSKKILKVFNLAFVYEYINSDSNLPSVDYNENIASLAFGFQF